jgi:hypothetical protein
MKKNVLFYLVALALLLTMPAKAIDTLSIDIDEWGINETIRDVIDADQGAHVYKLKRGGVYYFSGTLANDFPVVIVGEAGPADVSPAVITRATAIDGTSSNFIFESSADVTLMNLYLTGVDDAGQYRNFYKPTDAGLRLHVENCVCNFTNDWEGFFRFDSKDGVAILKNNIVMNMMREDGYVWATWLHTQNTKLDTLIVTNNTVFNCPNNMLSINEKELASPNYALVEHNTVVNTGKDILHFSYWLNMYTQNNLFYNPMIQGDAEISGTGWTDRVQCPDGQPYAYFKVDTIPNTTWRDSVLTHIGLTDRVVEISHNNLYQSPLVKSIPDMVAGDSGHVVEMLSPRSQAMFDDDAMWPGLDFDAATNTELDPGFTKNPTDESKLVAHALMLYRNSQPAVNFIYDPDNDNLTWEWPILGDVIDFTYSNATLATASTKGYHLGDLYHWYPAEYQNWVGIDNVVNDFGVSLGSAYPNPFVATTNIQYSIEKGGMVKVSVYDILGQEVATLVNEYQTPDNYSIEWNAVNVPEGTYFFRIDVNNQAGPAQKLIHMAE